MAGVPLFVSEQAGMQSSILKRPDHADVIAVFCWHFFILPRQMATNSFKGKSSQRVLPPVLKPAPAGKILSSRSLSCPLVSEPVRPELAWQKDAASRESLICEAETALAWQTPSTYRRWFSCWRGRG